MMTQAERDHWRDQLADLIPAPEAMAMVRWMGRDERKAALLCDRLDRALDGKSMMTAAFIIMRWFWVVAHREKGGGR